MAEDIFEQIKLFLPKYLTPEEKRELFAELRAFPDNKGFYLPPDAVDAQLLQGDGWRGFVAIDFFTSERRTVSGVILSNSCDIDAANPRPIPASVLFAPLISLEKYQARLEASGRTPEQIEATVAAIRSQNTTSVFFLPEGQYGPPASLILLDDIHSHPLDHFLDCERQRLFRLNQYAFYIFLIKLSIHLSRFQEGVKRFAKPAERAVAPR